MTIKREKSFLNLALLTITIGFNTVAMAEANENPLPSASQNQATTLVETPNTSKYQALQKNLGQVDLIHAATESALGKVFLGIDAGMTNFNYFIEHGDMKFQGPLSVVTIDFEKDDALNDALRSAFHETRDIVVHSDAFKVLTSEKKPTLKQRYAYEQVLVNAAFDAIENIPGLHQYRLDQASSSFGPFQTSNNWLPDNDLNKLSDDINTQSGQYNWDFECEKMSALKGVIMQSVENALLVQDNGKFNSAGSYFNAQGFMSQVSGFSHSILDKDEFSVSRNGHAYITSSKSGAVFEATADTASPQNTEYTEGHNNRILIPVFGTLSPQTEINENFELLASGAKVYYTSMDPESPGRMAPGQSVTDIHAYQVGSTEKVAIERLNAIYNGEFEKLSSLRSGHVWDEAAEKEFKSEIKDFEIFYRMYEHRLTMEDALRNYDPNNIGPEQVIMDVAKEHHVSLKNIPKAVNEAYQKYTSQGKDIPKELLVEISADTTGRDSLINVDIFLQSITSEHKKQEEAVANIKQDIVKAGHSSYVVFPIEDFLKSDRVNNIKSAEKQVQSMIRIYAQTENVADTAQSKTNTSSLKL